MRRASPLAGNKRCVMHASPLRYHDDSLQWQSPDVDQLPCDRLPRAASMSGCSGENPYPYLQARRRLCGVQIKTGGPPMPSRRMRVFLAAAGVACHAAPLAHAGLLIDVRAQTKNGILVAN